MNFVEILKDPFFISGVLALVSHLAQYYTILDRISTKIKNKKDEEFTSIKSEMAKDLKPENVLVLHNKCHTTDSKYLELEKKVTRVFDLGMTIAILLAIMSTRKVFTFVNADVVNIGILLIMVLGVYFCLNFYSLLKWNIKN